MSPFCRELSLLLLLLAHAQADNCLTAIVEETVQIPCSLNTQESLKMEDISVEWTTVKGLFVHSFVKGQDYWTSQAPQFKGRTQLFRSELSHGNLSLRLSSVSLTDDGEYVCTYHHSAELSSKLLCHMCLQTAGRYSVPVVQGPASPVFKDSEVSFTCKSTRGFPEPKVQWSVNKKLLQNSRRVNTTLSRDSRGLYNVTSVLTVNVTGDMSVTCTVENDRLREKTTSAEIQYLIKAEKESNGVSGGIMGILVLVAVLVVLVGLLIVAIVMLKRRKRKHQRNREPVSKDQESETPLQQTPNKDNPEAEQHFKCERRKKQDMESATIKPTDKAEADVIILEEYQSVGCGGEAEKSNQVPKRETRQSVKKTEAAAGCSTTFDKKKTDTWPRQHDLGNGESGL